MLSVPICDMPAASSRESAVEVSCAIQPRRIFDPQLETRPLR